MPNPWTGDVEYPPEELERIKYETFRRDHPEESGLDDLGTEPTESGCTAFYADDDYAMIGAYQCVDPDPNHKGWHHCRFVRWADDSPYNNRPRSNAQ